MNLEREEIGTVADAMRDDAPTATFLSATDGGADLDLFDRQLALNPAAAAAASLASSILDGFIGVAAGHATAAIFGTQVVPVDLAQLINDALEEIDRIVGDNIAEVCTSSSCCPPVMRLGTIACRTASTSMRACFSGHMAVLAA